MKQHITETQLTELSASQFKKLTKYVTEKNLLPHFTGSQLVLHPASKYLADCMNIGQMIEFLDENKDGFDLKGEDMWYVPRIEYQHPSGMLFFSMQWDNELCYALWEAVKKELENQTKKD